MMCACYGMDSTGYTVPYVAGWAETVKDKTPLAVMRDTGERVRYTVLAELDHLPTMVRQQLSVVCANFLRPLLTRRMCTSRGRRVRWMCLRLVAAHRTRPRTSRIHRPSRRSTSRHQRHRRRQRLPRF